VITPQYCQTMAAYNGWMNRKLYDAAAQLSDGQRKQDRGAFFGSIHPKSGSCPPLTGC
jgi:uncharacterized damage-inducible protein DinB